MTSLQPTVEDYHSDSDGCVLESFAGRKSPVVANVSTKRSHPSDLDKEKPPQERASPNIDLRSDSGYSSFTAATVSSADSAPSATSRRSPPLAPANSLPPSQSPAPKTRRPTVSADQRQHSSSPRPKTVSRTASQSSRRPPPGTRRPTVTQDRRDPREEECNDPTCTNCGPNALPRRRPEMPPSQSTRDIPMVPNPRSMRPDPTTYYNSPPSPISTRQQQYMQGPAVVQPAPRHRTSSTARQRPMSYGGESGPQYWAQGMPAPYPSPPQERGPPPAASAYRNMPQYHQMPYMVPPQANGYYPPQYPANQTSPPYDMPQRPALSNRNSSNYGTRNQPAPIVTQERGERPKYSARYAQPQSATQNKFPPLQIDNEAYESSESESEFEEEYEDPRITRALMPPPNIKRSQSQKRRPNLPHANTTQVVDRLDRRQSIVIPERSERERPERLDRLDRRQSVVMSERPARPERPDRPARRESVVMSERPDRMERRQSIVMPERPKERERSSRVSDASVRRPSTSRPAVLQRQTQSAYDTPTARVVVNNTKANRRSSSQIYDQMYEQYAQKKAMEERYAKEKAMEERFAKEKAHEAQMAQHRALEEAEARAREEQLKAEQRRKQRSSKVYYQPPKEFDESEEESESESESEEEERPTPLRNGRRRPTDVDNRKGKERIMEPKNKAMAAEDYISAQRGSQNPYADQIHKAAKRGSHIPSGPSESESSRSNGSDKQSLSARTVTTSNGGNEIRLRVDASAPLSLSFNGDMEGRTLHLVPVENGMADIVIGNARGESTYHGSERGSVVGTKQKALMASQARRDAEEMTERSSRSGRSRRDGREREIRDDRDSQRHVLRRRTDYRN